MYSEIIMVALFLSGIVIRQSDFLSEQKKFEHVRQAFYDKGTLVTETLENARINPKKLNVLFVVFKQERELVLYAKNNSSEKYQQLKTYPICEVPGNPGPKRQQGDNQVPEGFYHIDRYNPASRFYLSLGINYPNAADLKKTTAVDPGGDIFIHGSCVTIGCLPMTDEIIKEIYIYAIQARANGQMNMPVYIFPFKMTPENMAGYLSRHPGNPDLTEFWSGVKAGYDRFQQTSQELVIKVDNRGNYTF